MSNIWTDDEAAQWSKHWATEGTNPEGQFWARAGDPDKIKNNFGGNISPEFLSTLNKMVGNLYSTAGDAYSSGVPEGYATPI